MELNGHHPRYGMVIDVDRCTGCGACMLSCAVEHNVPPAHEGATDRTGLTWLRVNRVDNERAPSARQTVFVPIMCQHCDEHPPCESVCPQNAVEYDEESGIVTQIPVRCLGCRYCMTACPYHARSFNWWDPQWPAGFEETLNPEVSTRMRGVVEKCNFCHARYHDARAKAAAEGRKPEEAVDYTPACVDACPTHAIAFGNLADPSSEVSRRTHQGGTFRLLEQLGTEPKVFCTTNRPWVREQIGRSVAAAGKEQRHG